MSNSKRTRPFRLNGWLVNPTDGSLAEPGTGRVHRLEPRVMALLLHLATKAGELVSKEQLLEAVWGETVVEEGALARCVSDIRRVFQDRPAAPRFIETVPKRGYRLVAEIADGENALSESREMSPSIAVLPFLDLSPGRDHGYFADGLAEELIHSLAQVRGLHVAARTSSFQFDARGADLKDVGRQLKVSTVLEGSVRREGDRLRVAVQLIETQTGYHLFSHRYDRPATSLFEIQAEIADLVVRETRPELLADWAPGDVRATDLRAHELCLKASQRLHRGTREDVAAAIELYRRAIELDAGSAAAWSGLSGALTASIALVPDASRSAKVDEARFAAQKAIEAGDGQGRGVLALAAIELFEWNWCKALEVCQRAEEAMPGSAQMHFTYQQVLKSQGRLEEAAHHAELACDLDPLAVSYRRGLGTVYLMQQRWEEALQQLGKAAELRAEAPFLPLLISLALWGQGDAQASVAALQTMLGIEEPDQDHGVQHPTASLSAALELWQRGSVDGLWFFLASFYAVLGEEGKALNALERSVASREPAIINLASWPFFGELRRADGALHRFEQVLERAGLES